ncbi:MAG: carboxypeptidase-like regulatory domain-containing protein [Planctomycetaceae bacterium]|jgi:hypothetical protein|nr:carboxypeptidase-like regulatory domain-containing protein [Planctomycetaceae bacterium]
MKIITKNIFLFTFVFVLAVSGCTGGAKLVPAGGTVTQNGKPLSDVRLEFRQPDTGTSAFAETDVDGKFVLTHSQGGTGAVAGKYIVSIFQKGKPIPLPTGINAEDLPEERRNPMSPEIEIRNSDNSNIEIEIPETGNNNLKIEVK